MAEQTQRLAIIGCGFMGSAILEGLLQNSPAEGTPRLSYTAHVNSSTSLTRLQESFSSNSTNITFTSGPENLIQTVTSSDIILLGFLPTQLLQILTSTPDLATHLKGKTIISMLAGISTSQLLDALVSHCPGSAPSDFSLARIIPTLSAKICSSVTLLAEPCSPVARTAVEKIFSRVGSLHPIPEKLMDTATAIGAAMHALAIVAVDSATDCSVAEGLPRETALSLTASCLKSCTALMTTESSGGGEGKGGGGMTPETVKAAMSTPAGITLNALVHLDANVRPGIAGTVREAVRYTRGMNE